MSEKSSSSTSRSNLRDAQSADAGMDQLLRHRQHEGLSEGIWPVDAAQGQSSYSQAMKEAEDHLQEPAKTEPNRKVQAK